MTSVPNQLKQFDPQGQYNLVNGMTGQQLTENHGRPILFNGHHNAHSSFIFKQVSAGWYIIINGRTRGVFDVESESPHPGAKVLFWSEHGNANQQWQFITTDRPDHYLVKAKHSGLFLGYQNDTIVQTAFVPNAMYQIWHITPAELRAGINYIPNQAYTITSVGTGERIVTESSRAVVRNTNEKSLWNLHETIEGYFYLYHVGDNLMLDVERELIEDGAELCVWKTNSRPNQQFKFVATNNPTQFLIQVKHSGKYLTAHNGKLCQFGHNGQANQLWVVNFA
jgi:hypothetical protein